MNSKTMMWKTLKNKKGQALFEMVLFLPFLIILYSMFYTIGNSINGSINQQKAVRGYFYSLLKGNSYVNTYADLVHFQGIAFNKIGFASVGWRERSENQGQRVFAPCFHFVNLLNAGDVEDCAKRERDSDSTKIIRVYTYYGVCGPVYTTKENAPVFGILPENQSAISGCMMTK